MNLIEQIEEKTGKRWDDPSGLPPAQLIGAIAREMGASKFEGRNDIAVGILLQDQFINGKGRLSDEALSAMVDLFGPDATANLYCKQFLNGNKKTQRRQHRYRQ